MNPWTQSSSTRIPPKSPKPNPGRTSPKWACRANQRRPLRCCKTTKKSNKLHHRLRKTYEKLNNLMKINWWEDSQKVLGTSKSQLRPWLTTCLKSSQLSTSSQTTTSPPLKSQSHRGLPPRLLASLTWRKTQILTNCKVYTCNYTSRTWRSKSKNKKREQDKRK